MPFASASDRPRRLVSPPGGDPIRILSRADCEALFKRIVALTNGRGETQVYIRSTWISNLRWGRNRPTTVGNTIERHVSVFRQTPGGGLSSSPSMTELKRLDDATIKAAVQKIEEGREDWGEPDDGIFMDLPEKQAYLAPALWSEATYKMTTQELSDAVRKSVEPAVNAKLITSGYAEIGAINWAVFNTRGLDAYYTATGASYAATVRLPDGTGSGWAGGASKDWATLDIAALSAAAQHDCLSTANPRALEPGRYTAILLPPAVANLMAFVVEEMSQEAATYGAAGSDKTAVYSAPEGWPKTKFGLQIFDNRITISSDPMDPDCGFIPFDPEGNPYHRVNWVENGVLKEMPYARYMADSLSGPGTAALPNPLAFRVSGGTASIEEMISTTGRGLLVAGTTPVELADGDQNRKALSVSGLTRNGFWLIEHGQIVHPIKNMWFSVSMGEVLNQIMLLGQPKRTLGVPWYGSNGGDVLHDLPTQVLNGGRTPVVVPAMKVRDFNFTRLTDAI